jgi:hypothetical protein
MPWQADVELVAGGRVSSLAAHALTSARAHTFAPAKAWRSGDADVKGQIVFLEPDRSGG